MKLTKIKLINWHLFSDAEIPVDGNVVLTGENGSGKSTLLDALFYVLSGGDDSNFNNAANSGAARTLESYLRGKLGTEENTFIRSNCDVISHIALEFFDMDRAQYNVMGVVMQLQKVKTKADSRFYFIFNHRLAEEDYVVKGTVRSYGDLKEYCEKNGYGFTAFEGKGQSRSKKNNRKQICGFFKLQDSEKYYSLLKNALAFRPMSEVNSFVNEFLLESNPVEIDALLDEIREYRQINATLQREEEKQALLETFVHKAEDLVRDAHDAVYLDVMRNKAAMDRLNHDLSLRQTELGKKKDELSVLLEKKQTLEEELARLQKELALLEDDEAYKAILSKQRDIDAKKKSLEAVKEEIRRTGEMLRNEKKILSCFGLNCSFQKDIANGNYPLLKEHLRSCAEKLKECRNDLYSRQAELNGRRAQAVSDISRYNSELADLGKGRNTYDRNTSRLLKVLRENLKDSSGNPAEVKPLCEYMEVRDEAWRNAIEGYMNTQRFDILVEPQYFDRAVRLYEDCKKEYGIHSVGIINADKEEDSPVLQNSLYEKVEVDNRYADAAVRRILGRVMCVDEVEDLKKYRTAITRTCMTYRNHVARNINPDIYSYPFIGENSVIRRKEILSGKLQECTEEKERIDNELKETAKGLNLCAMSNAEKLQDTEDIWSREKELSLQIEVLEKELKEDQKAQGMIELQMKIDRVKDSIRRARYNQSLNDGKIFENNKATGKLETEIHGLEEDLNVRNREYEISFRSVKNEEEYTAYCAGFMDGDALDGAKIDKEIEKIKNRRSANISLVLNGMREYSNRYRSVLVPGEANIQDYIDEYYRIISRDLVKYREKARQAQENSEHSFREDFLSKMNEKIRNAKAVLDELNRHLKTHPFGTDGEVYQFEYSASGDDRIAEYYRIITSGGVTTDKPDLFSEVLSSKDYSIIMDLLKQVSTEAKTEQERRELEGLLDYRNYMKYDIKITNRNKEVSYFSKTYKEKSGGETQTPFYVIMACCFESLMESRSYQAPSTCTVVFDEAFNNMDEGRIKSLMEFYKELNIQLIMAVPSLRMPFIYPHVDSAVALMRNKRSIQIRELRHD